MNYSSKVMTVFYYKDNGDIHSITTQDIGFEFFIRQSEAMKTILDRVVVDIDETIMSNLKMFRVIEGKITLTDSFKKYI